MTERIESFYVESERLTSLNFIINSEERQDVRNKAVNIRTEDLRDFIGFFKKSRPGTMESEKLVLKNGRD